MTLDNKETPSFHTTEHTDLFTINMGPSHPATHGTVKFLVSLDGEIIEKLDVEIGYLHRGFEKECEAQKWNGIFPFTDRLDYTAASLNSIGCALAIEKLIGIELPERATYLRMIMSELSRLSGHYTCLGAAALELGAMTAFLYFVEARELVWDLIEAASGARLTHNYVRVGGLNSDLPKDFKANVKSIFKKNKEFYDKFAKLLLKNRIFIDRMKDIGGISGEDAIAWGFTGPCLRAAGIAYDVRKASPYLAYDKVDFEMPIGTTGDNLDRFMVRMEEIVQSISIIEQALEMLPDGPINIDDPRYRQPSKDRIHKDMESMIFHFKSEIDGIQVPAGETYLAVEGANGELGFYVVSDGSGYPLKLRVRPPCFQITSALPKLIKGALLSDLIPTFDMINLIGGECDR
ncbi:MAG: NADH-quinone oxidoreductase subunit D [Nitrospinota bacterium]